MYLLKENDVLAKQHEVVMKIERKETSFFGLKSVLDLESEPRWHHTEIVYENSNFVYEDSN